MKTSTTWRAGIASDPGRQRPLNEDRVFADEARGVFLVVDGLGGHAAGETAAETALQVLQERIASLDGDEDLEQEVREAISAANNEIYQLAQDHAECKGMACVLTMAVAREDRVTVGHVGDSRLYLAWNGELRKLTSDHSPVGEQEDNRELTEQEAMNHPRRNEVYRDVGSQVHNADDPEFVETKSFLFRPDAALLLCSDGLSDMLTSAQISSIVERYEGDPDVVARELIEAANRAGGKDNVSVVFVPGSEFLGRDAGSVSAARQRHAVTRIRPETGRWGPVLRNISLVLIGMLLGVALWIGIQRFWP
jgi:serine/threonine protein phosphatase PrpC